MTAPLSSTQLSAAQLAAILGGRRSAPITARLPASGRAVAITQIQTTEVRAAEPVSQARSCWAPNKVAIEDPDGPTWPEFAIVRRLKRAGWDARWIKNWTGASEFCSDVDRAEALPEDVAKVFQGIHDQAVALRGAGSWDVLAWRGDDFLFIESKQHRSSDKLNPNQLAWLEAALTLGFDLGSLPLCRTTRALRYGRARFEKASRSTRKEVRGTRQTIGHRSE